MPHVIDLLTSVHLDPALLDRADPTRRSAALAAHLDQVADALWRLAFAMARVPIPSTDGPDGVGPLLAAERSLEEHWDPHVRELAELAGHAESVAGDVRCTIEDASIPF